MPTTPHQSTSNNTLHTLTSAITSLAPPTSALSKTPVSHTLRSTFTDSKATSKAIVSISETNTAPLTESPPPFVDATDTPASGSQASSTMVSTDSHKTGPATTSQPSTAKVSHYTVSYTTDYPDTKNQTKPETSHITASQLTETITKSRTTTILTSTTSKTSKSIGTLTTPTSATRSMNSGTSEGATTEKTDTGSTNSGTEESLVSTSTDTTKQLNSGTAATQTEGLTNVTENNNETMKTTSSHSTWTAESSETARPNTTTTTNNNFTTTTQLANITTTPGTEKTNTYQSKLTGTTLPTTEKRSSAMLSSAPSKQTTQVASNATKGPCDGVNCPCHTYLYGSKCMFIQNDITLDAVSTILIVTVHIENLNFTSSLTDEHSPQYQTFQNRFLKEMTDFYRLRLPNFEGVRINSVREGSVVVDHDVLLRVSFKHFTEETKQTEQLLWKYLNETTCTSNKEKGIRVLSEV
ncbi:uncharacterized protein [Hyperolius riggenbachi]|uniref:uncharacterized protein n=1 Tax=Hyperolius riggenbachi TaxID=752182 RepID=UPI0035A34A66